MSNPFQLVWRDSSGKVLERMTFPITYPGVVTDSFLLSLQSSAASNLTFESLINVAFYLIGSDVGMVQGRWPYITDAYGDASDTVTGGFEASFDNGLTWSRFSKTVGWQADPTTWITLPAASVGFAGVAGQISALESARLMVRYVIPPSVNIARALDISIAVDCDIV